MYETVSQCQGHGYWHTLFGNPFSCMQKVLSGTISDVQCSSSSGTIGKSSSSSGLSEYTGVLSGYWSSSEMSEDTGVLSGSWSLSELNDRQQHTGLVGVCGELQGVIVIVLQSVVCAGLKDACSMLDTWCMQGVFLKGVGRSTVSQPLS